MTEAESESHASLDVVEEQNENHYIMDSERQSD